MPLNKRKELIMPAMFRTSKEYRKIAENILKISEKMNDKGEKDSSKKKDRKKTK